MIDGVVEIKGIPYYKVKRAKRIKRIIYYITLGLFGCLYEKLKLWQS